MIDSNTIFTSYTYGKLSFNQVCDRLLDFYHKYKGEVDNIEIAVGSDSHNTHETRMVTAIVIYAEGKGGISFNFIEKLPRVNSVKEKLELETGRSLVTATTLIEVFENNDKYNDLYLDCPISIHVDAGNSLKGKTRDLIKFISGWVHSTGFNCMIKPDSYAASSIADKISK